MGLIMKYLAALILMVAMSVFGAVPDYKAFRGGRNTVVTTNPPTGTVITQTTTNQTFIPGGGTWPTDGIRIGFMGPTEDDVSTTTWGVWDLDLDVLAMSYQYGTGGWDFSSRVTAELLTIDGIPGSGSIVAVDAGGATYRTNVSGGTQNIQTNGVPVSNSATGQVYFAGNNMQVFATNASGRVSILVRVSSNLLFNAAGQEFMIGSDNNSLFGISNITRGGWDFYTSGDGSWNLAGPLSIAGNVTASNATLVTMPGVGAFVNIVSSGLLMRTNTIDVTNVNTRTLFTTNGIQGNWPDTQVFWSSNGWIMSEGVFTYDRGDNILSVPGIVTTNISIYGSASFYDSDAIEYSGLTSAPEISRNTIHRMWTDTNAGVVSAYRSGTGTNQLTNIVGTSGQVLSWQNNQPTWINSGPTLTNITAWTETFGGTLGNWEVRSNGAAWSISGGKLLVENNGSSPFGCVLVRTNWVTMFKNWTMTCQVVPGPPTATTYGLAFGMRSTNAFDDTKNVYWNLGLAASPTYFSFYAGPNNFPTNYTLSPFTNLVWSAGDTLDVSLVRRDHVWSLTVSNTANASVLSAAYTTSLIATQYPFEPTASSFAFWSVGGTQTVDNVTFTLNAYSPVSTLCIGDSITSGAGAATHDQAWAKLLGRNMGDLGIQVAADGSDYTANVLKAVPELNLLSPSNVVLMIGGNDVAFGVSAATWKLNYSNLVASITRSGTLYHCLPTPRDATDMGTLAEFISTNYARSAVIDTFDPLRAGDNSKALRNDVDADNVHPNSLGHSIIANAVENKLRGR